MTLYQTSLNKKVELTEERKKYILLGHPELKNYLSKIKQVLLFPDEIRISKRDKNVLLFYRYFAKILGGKYIVIVTKLNSRNFILTSYLTDRIKIGEKYEQKN